MKHWKFMAMLHVAVTFCLNTMAYDLEANTVMFSNDRLKRGSNEIVVNCDVISRTNAFTTLDQVVQFFPPNGILGDELVFDLDGYRQRYSFVEYNETNNTYRLFRVGNNPDFPQVISLDSIPLLDKFWINHKGEKVVYVSSSGEVTEKYVRSALPRKGRNRSPLEVRFVSEAGVNQSIIFGNGLIESEPQGKGKK